MKTLILIALFMGQIITGHYRKPRGGPAPVAAWPQNDGSGLTLSDVSGNANTATISAAGAVTWQTNGTIPGTTTFWTSTGGARAANATPTAFDGSSPFTICTWLIPNTLNTDNWVVTNFDASTTALQGYGLEIPVNAGIRFYLINNLATPTYIDVSTPTSNLVPIGSLTQVCIVYSGSRTAAGVTAYSNGVARGLTVNKDTLGAGSTASVTPITLGAAKNGAGFTSPYHGAQAFTELWPVAFTGTQIANNFALGPRIN